MEVRSPGAIERIAARLLEPIPQLFLYGPVVLIVGWLLATSGRGELELKSYGIVTFALWLAVDLWHWLFKRDWQWRIIVGWTATNLLFIGAMMVMWWWLSGALKDQEDNVGQHFNVSMSQLFGRDIRDSIVSVTNGGEFEIGRYELGCEANAMWSIEYSGAANVFLTSGLSNGEVLEAGRDGHSENCLRGISLKGPTKCMDITVHVKYSLTTQPALIQEKQFHFYTEMGAGSWFPEPLESKKEFCHMP